MTFDTWIQSESGKRCSDDTRQPILNPYLKNRLYHAYEAGLISGEFDNRLLRSITIQAKLLFKYKQQVGKLKRELREFKKQKS